MLVMKISKRHREHDHVLRPEDLAQDDELALDNVDQEQRVAVDADERPGEHDRQQQPAQPGARRGRSGPCTLRG